MASLTRTVTMDNPFYSSKRSRFGPKSGKVVARPNKKRQTWPTKKGWNMYYDPFPTMQRAQFRYCTDVFLDPGTGVPSHHIFNACSIFDPDTSGVGHQPYGHDQYATIYNHYRVDKAIITVTPTLQSTAIIGVALQSDTTQQLDRDVCRERKGAVVMPLQGNNRANKLQLTYYRKGTFPLDTSDSYSALFGNNPAESVYFDLFMMGNANSQNPGGITFQVTVSYFCTLWEPKTLLGS